VVNKNEEYTTPASDIPILFKIGDYFIPKQQIRSVTRFGKGCKIMLISGNEMVVRVNFEKVSELVK
jgi:hypothetical protein